MWASQLRNYRSGGDKKGANDVKAKKTYGSLYLNLKQKKPHRGGSPDGGYSLYSTESEDTPVKLSKDLDRCATLLTTLLEKDPVGRRYNVKPTPRLNGKSKCVGKVKAKAVKPKKDKRRKLSAPPRKQPVADRLVSKEVAPPVRGDHNPVRVEVKLPQTTASPQPERDDRPVRMAPERLTGDKQTNSSVVSPLQPRDFNGQTGIKFDTSHHPMAPFRPHFPVSATPFNKRLSSSTPAMSPAGIGRPPAHARQSTSFDDLGSWPESSRSSRSLDFGPTPQCLNLTVPESVSGPLLKHVEPVMEYQPVRDSAVVQPQGATQSEIKDMGIGLVDHQVVPPGQSGLRYDQSSQSAPTSQPTNTHFSAGYYSDTRVYDRVTSSVQQPNLPADQPGYLAEFHENKENEHMNFDFGEYLMPSGVYEFGTTDVTGQQPLGDLYEGRENFLQMVPTRETDSIDQGKYEENVGHATDIHTGPEPRPAQLGTLPDVADDVREATEGHCGPAELEPIREEEEKSPTGSPANDGHHIVSEGKDMTEKVKNREAESTNNPQPSKSKPWKPPGKASSSATDQRESHKRGQGRAGRKRVSARSNSRSPDKENKKDSGEQKKEDTRTAEMKAHLVRLQCVSRELGVILDGDPEGNRILAELDNAVQRLTIDIRTQHPGTGLDLQPYPQTDLDLAMQPIRSENAQLRRRLRILNQQLRDRERTERDTNRSDQGYHLVHLQTINQALQKQLNDGKASRLQLQQRVQQLSGEIDQLNSEKREMLLVLENKDDDKLRLHQEHAKELMKTSSDLRLAQQEVESLKRQLEAMEHDSQILHLTVQQKEQEIERLQHLVRGLQQSMTQLLSDLKSSRPLSGQRDSPHVRSAQLAQCLLEDSIGQVDIGGPASEKPKLVSSIARQAWKSSSEDKQPGKKSKTVDPTDSPARRALQFEVNDKESSAAKAMRDEGASNMLTERALREHQLSQYHKDKKLPPESSFPQLSRFVKQNTAVDKMDNEYEVGEVDDEEFVGQDRWATIHDYSDEELGKPDDFLSDKDPDETQYIYFSPPSRRRTVDSSDLTTSGQVNVDSGKRESAGTTVKDVLTSLASKIQAYSGDEASSPGGVTADRTYSTLPRSDREKSDRFETDSADQSRYSVTEYFKKYPRTTTTLPAGIQKRSGTLSESHGLGLGEDQVDSPPSTIKETESVSSGSTLDTVTSFDDRAFQEGLANLDANIARIQDSLKQASKR